MKTKILRGLLFVALGYILFVALHFIYLEIGGATRRGPELSLSAPQDRAVFDVQMPAVLYKSEVRNYATAQFFDQAKTSTFEQKYEKVGSLSAATAHFESDEQHVRSEAQRHAAIIQEEQVNSENGRRLLRLVLGVPPDKFDTVVAALKSVGAVVSFEVTKTDRTNEFLELRAKRTTLEKSRDALVALKSQAGKIEEFVKVEQEILALEDKIQALGVKLGHFEKSNEFCTVRYTLSEQFARTGTPHLRNLIESLEWASTVYLICLASAFVGLLVVVLVLAIVEKSKLFRVEP